MPVQFFQTVMGSRFFNGQLPALIRNLGKIAVALEKMASVAEVATETDREICRRVLHQIVKEADGRPLTVEGIIQHLDREYWAAHERGNND